MRSIRQALNEHGELVGIMVIIAVVVWAFVHSLGA